MDTPPRTPASPADSASDKEKGLVDGKPESVSVVEQEQVREEAPASFYVSKFGPLGPYLEKLFASGVEARGIERVPEDQRMDSNVWNL